MPKDMQVSFLLDFYGDILTSKQQKVLDFYYNEDLSLAEISEHVGITRQGVLDLIKRAEIQIYQTEDKLKLASKFMRINRVIGSILEDILIIENENNKFFKSTKIETSVNNIKDKIQKLNN